MISDIRTRQFGLLDIMREGWRVYAAKLIIILPIVLIIYGPFLLLLALIPEKALTESLGKVGFMLLQQGLFLVFGFVALISNVGIAHIVEETVLGRESTWRGALRFGASRWMAAFLTNLLAGIILFGLLLLFLVPGIIWSVYYNFWIYAVANRALTGKKALDYSKNLVRGQWWRVCGIQVVLLLITGAVTFAINQLLALIPAGQVITVLTSLVTFLIASVLSVMLNVWFLNIDYLKNPIEEMENTALIR
ncbi:MAG: hypothetical protein AB9891_01245 [Anaerolineaceae bacterium]